MSVKYLSTMTFYLLTLLNINDLLKDSVWFLIDVLSELSIRGSDLNA